MITVFSQATRHTVRKGGSDRLRTFMALATLQITLSVLSVPVANAQTPARAGLQPTGRLIEMLDEAIQQNSPVPTLAPPLVHTSEISSATSRTDATTDSASLNKAVNAATDAREAAIQAKHNEEVAAYEARKKADQEAYAAQIAAYEAEVKRVEARRIAETAAWQARVAACKAGDISQCGK